MKKLLVAVLLVGFGFTLSAEAGYVNGYYRSNGTYVNGYYRSDANGLRYDNYSYDGGYRYNSTYGTRGTSWDTPAWQTQDDYWTGYDSYNSYNDYEYDYYDYSY